MAEVGAGRPDHHSVAIRRYLPSAGSTAARDVWSDMRIRVDTADRLPQSVGGWLPRGRQLVRRRAKARGRTTLALIVALGLGGCSADIAMFRADRNWWTSSGERTPPLTPQAAPPDALVGPDGGCTGEPAQPVRGVAVGMTECDLVRLAGPTDRIAIRSNERGEREAVLTYPAGDHAGIYRFQSGVLVSVERVPAAPPARPARPARRSNRAN